MPTARHIENPFEYVLEKLSWTAQDLSRAASARPRLRAVEAPPTLRRIEAADLTEALRQGLADVGAVRDDVLFIAVIYPLAGLLLAALAFRADLLPLVFPLASGFALIGPLAAVGLYEISRRRERGEDVGWSAAFRVLRSPNIGSILGLGAIQVLLFFAWLAVAYGIYAATLGPQPPASAQAFLNDVFRTPSGWTMIVVGLGAGFIFAAFALAISVVSFPLLLDRDVSLGTAIATSLRAVAANPRTMALWGLIVAGLLVAGSIPALVGLIVVMPVLGHATWRLYRKLVVGEG